MMLSFISWLKMGGYFAYVWSAYGFVALILGLNLWSLRLKRLKTERKLRQFFKRQAHESNS